MKRFSCIAFAFALALATPALAEDICSDNEAYRFGHEGRMPPSICRESARYMSEYRRGEIDGRAAIMDGVGTGLFVDDMLENDDDFFYHTHYHDHGYGRHSHRHHHHNSHNGENHGRDFGQHNHHMHHSGGFVGGGHHNIAHGAGHLGGPQYLRR